MRWETTRPFLVSRKILGFLSIFKKSQASSPLKHWTPRASRSVKRCEAPCPDEAGNRVFSRVSTEDSDIPSSWEMKDETALKPLQGNPTLFVVRESRYPLKLRHQNQGPSHIPIAQGRLLLRCLWKLAYLFNRIWESAFFSKWYGLNREFLEFLCCNWCS